MAGHREKWLKQKRETVAGIWDSRGAGKASLSREWCFSLSLSLWVDVHRRGKEERQGSSLAWPTHIHQGQVSTSPSVLSSLKLNSAPHLCAHQHLGCDQMGGVVLWLRAHIQRQVRLPGVGPTALPSTSCEAQDKSLHLCGSLLFHLWSGNKYRIFPCIMCTFLPKFFREK